MNENADDDFNAFSQCYNEFTEETNNIRRIQIFENICEILNNLSDFKQINGKAWHKITEFAVQNAYDINLFEKFISILSRSKESFSIEKSSLNCIRLLEDMIYLSVKDISLIEKCENFFFEVISNKKAAQEFATEGTFEKVFSAVFKLHETKEASNFLRKLIFDKANGSFFTSVSQRTLQKMFDVIISQSVKKDLIFDCAEIFAIFFQSSTVSNPKCCEVIRKENSINSYLKFISELEEPQKISLLFKLIDSGTPPNTDVISQLVQGESQLEAYKSRALISIIEKYHKEIQKIQNIIPFSRIVEGNISAEEALKVIGIISLNDPTLCPQCICGVLKILNPETCKAETYIQAFVLIDKQLLRRQISLSELYRYNFLKTFVIDVPHKYLIQFFKTSATFVQLILDVYSICSEEEMKEKVMETIFELISFKEVLPMLSTAMSGFICVWPSTGIVKKVTKLIETKQFSDLGEALILSCTKNVKVANAFVEIGGIKWTLDGFSSNAMTEKQLSLLVASLAAHPMYKTLDKCIHELPDDHPIFKINKEYVEPIVFGTKQMTLIRQIRISSMFHLLPSKEISDPYNLWMIGKNCLSKLTQEDRNKLVPAVANRYVLPEQVSEIINSTIPIDKCCDPLYDHFPLFQFYPGEGELVIDTEYSMCSFWFKFCDYVSYEVSLFKAFVYDNVQLQISIRDTLLTAECDGQKLHIDINAVVWNFVIIRVEQGMMSTTIHLNTGTDEVLFQIKRKVSSISKAIFGSSKQTVVLLGSSIRFAKQYVHDFSVLEGRGPGSMKPSSYLKETLTITPLNIDNSIVPDNLFTVHYFGLPRHIHSSLHQEELINLLGDPEKASSALTAITNIAVITKGQLKYFLERTLIALKKFRPNIQKDVLKTQLLTLLEQSTTPREELFFAIFNDMELWDNLPNDVIIEILFDLFGKFNFRAIDSAEKFFAERALKDPTNTDLIKLLLENHKRIPKTFKYLMAMMKCSPAIMDLNWESIKSRPQDPLQLAISECIPTIINRSNVDFVASALPFDEMKFLMIASHNQMASNMFHIIATLGMYIPNYIQLEPVFLTSLCRLTGYTQTWKDALVLASGETTTTKVIKNIGMIPILLHLTWSAALVVFHTKAYKIESERVSEIEGIMNLALASCMNIMQKIVDSQLCITILLFYFPLIMNYPMLFSGINDDADRPSPINSDNLSAAQINDSTDSLWQGLTIPSTMKFPAPDLPYTPFEFLRNTITSIFRGFGLKMELGEPDTKRIVQWMSTSPLFLFMSDALFKSSTHFLHLSRAFFIGSPFRDSKKPKEITQQFLHIVMSCMTVPLSSNIPFTKLFQFIHLLAGLDLLTGNSVQAVSDLLLLCSSIVWSFKETYLMKMSDQLLPVLLQLIAVAPEEKHEEILAQVRKSIKIITSLVIYNKCVPQWIYCFLSQYNVGDEVFQWFEAYNDKQLFNTAKADITQLRPYWDEFTKQFQKIFEESSNNSKLHRTIIVDFGQISRDTIKNVFIANSKHFLIANLLNAELNNQSPTPHILRELRQWEIFRFNLMEKMRKSANENPENKFLSMKCSPFFPPKLISPLADNPGICQFHKKPTIPRNQCFQIFCKVFERFGHPQNTSSCVFMRYGDAIPSVLLTYNNMISIILFATMQNNELVLIDGYSEIFEESLLAGQIGKLWLFDSHFVVEIKTSDLLAIHCTTKNSISVWSFSYGNFLIRFEKEITQQIRNYVNKIDEEVTKTFLFDHLLDQFKTKQDASLKWQNRSISTYQFVLILNALSGYSFADIEMFPSFPPFLDPPEDDPSQNTPFPSSCEVSMIMSAIQPFKKLPKTEVKSNSLPATMYVIPELFDNKFESIKLKESLETENSRLECMQWARTHFVIRPVRTNSLTTVAQENIPPSKKKSKKNEFPVQLPPLSGRTNMLKSAYVIIDPKNIKLEIIDNLTNKVYVRYIDHAFDRAYAMSASSNGLFIVVDFKFGESRAYRIVYENDLPNDIMLLSSYSSPSLPRSTVSGVDWLCATAYDNKVVMWDILSGIVHRTIPMESNVLKASFDTKQSSIWIALHKKAFVYSINGTFLASVDTPPLKWLIADYDIFCETESGQQIVLELNYEKGVIHISSPSDNEIPHITAIGAQNNLRRILSYDAAMKQWMRHSTRSRVEYSHCAICNSPAHGVCSVCNKHVCEQCTIFDKDGPICKRCHELNLTPHQE